MPACSPRRRRIKRAVVVLVVLVVATLLNLAVAWTLAIVQPRETLLRDARLRQFENARPKWHETPFAPDPPNVTAWYWKANSMTDARGVGWETRSFQFFGKRRDGRTRRVSDDRPPDILKHLELPDDELSFRLFYTRSGWPTPAWRGATVFTGPPHDSTYTTTAWIIDNPGWTEVGRLRANGYYKSKSAERQINGRTKIMLPYRPLWFGFVVNTVFYALILSVLFFLPVVLSTKRRRARRRERGLCPACAYPLRAGGDVCSECGYSAA